MKCVTFVSNHYINFLNLSLVCFLKTRWKSWWKNCNSNENILKTLKTSILEKFFLIISYLYNKLIILMEEKYHKYLQKSSEIHITSKNNFLKYILYSLDVFNFTKTYLNWPITEEGGKIQISKLVQLWTKVLSNWDQILRSNLQKLYLHGPQIIFWAIHEDRWWSDRAYYTYILCVYNVCIL